MIGEIPKRSMSFKKENNGAIPQAITNAWANYRHSECTWQGARPLIQKAKTPFERHQDITPDVPGAPPPGAFPGAPALPGSIRRQWEETLLKREQESGFEMNVSLSSMGHVRGYHYKPDPESQRARGLFSMSVECLAQTGNEEDRRKAAEMWQIKGLYEPCPRRTRCWSGTQEIDSRDIRPLSRAKSMTLRPSDSISMLVRDDSEPLPARSLSVVSHSEKRRPAYSRYRTHFGRPSWPDEDRRNPCGIFRALEDVLYSQTHRFKDIDGNMVRRERLHSEISTSRPVPRTSRVRHDLHSGHCIGRSFSVLSVSNLAPLQEEESANEAHVASAPDYRDSERIAHSLRGHFEDGRRERYRGGSSLSCYSHARTSSLPSAISPKLSNELRPCSRLSSTEGLHSPERIKGSMMEAIHSVVS
ncbi:uncharacterized protein PV09_05943 [Verruconis gallopava]|uniref:Uncharacterized protein n=1 Tax=Verruconis gallopava TaxID=253628 RepID=A0A0D2A809_9PEZI|nr:uncharacterized protein PV09_05943 [Verruconis gallopava]KIW02893.1 hypothetical protein PV09_05943 [Verruconis gallopava]